MTNINAGREDASPEFKVDIDKLAEAINEWYGYPFLPEGFVKAHVTKAGTLWLDIGDRTVEFALDGGWIASDTGVGEGAQWRILKL
jgi:hypothetical protein